MTIPRIPLRKALIKICYACNNRCVFCHARPNESVAPLAPEAVLKKMRAAAGMGMEMIVFSGGEPTLRKDLPTLAREAAGMGLQVGLVTNARMLSYEDYFNKLFDFGFGYALISLHGPDAATHDRLTGIESFEQTLAGLARCVEAGVNVTVNTVIVRENIGRLGDIAAIVSRYKGAALKFAFVEPKGAVLDDFDSIVPDISAAADALNNLFGDSENLFCDGFTPCLIPEFDRRNDDLFTHGIEYMSEVYEDGFFPVDHGARAFAPQCENCSAKTTCHGIYRDYLARRGAAEFVQL